MLTQGLKLRLICHSQLLFYYDWFDTDEGDTVLDSTVLVDEDNITDCGVIDDKRND